MPPPWDILELLTKCVFIYFEWKNGSKKDAHRRHPIHLIILFKFKAVAERRQWSSASSNPRRMMRVKLSLLCFLPPLSCATKVGLQLQSPRGSFIPPL